MSDNEMKETMHACMCSSNSLCDNTPDKVALSLICYAIDLLDGSS